MRIKFFSLNDLSVGFYLPEIEKKLNQFDENTVYEDINDILEFYNIDIFIKNNIFIEEKQKYYETKSKSFSSIFGKTLNKIINEENIIDILSKVENLYISDFWKLFSIYKLYQKISPCKFKEVLNNYNIYSILKNRKIVEFYAVEIKDYLISNNDKSVELYLDEYYKEVEDSKEHLYFPSSLTREEKERQLELYVTNDMGKFNYFKLILDSFSNNELRISPILRKKIKETYNNLINTYFKENPNSFDYGYNICFRKNQLKSKVINKIEDKNRYCLEFKYSLDWIKENLDYPTLLNNFIYLFEFVDEFFIFTNVSYREEFGIFEILQAQVKDKYRIGHVFELKELLSKNKFIAYYQILKKYNIDLEKILEYFFKDYLLKEFGVENYIINLPAENLTYLEKCKCITSEIEKVIKEFTLYKKYNKIDNELLEYLTDQVVFDDIESLLNEKYVYINEKNNKINAILFYLFSNNSDLRYIKIIDKTYKTFVTALFNEKITKSMLSSRQLKIINFLLEEEIIQEDKNGYIDFDKKLMIILKILYDKEVLCINYLEKYEKEIKFLKDKNMIYYESTLFSKKESKYLKYLLKSHFSNGLELRNKYSHGTYPLDEKEHFNDYFKFLEILVLIIIKINEEFCLFDKLKNKQSN